MQHDYHATALDSRAKYALAMCLAFTDVAGAKEMQDDAADLALTAGREAFDANFVAECPMMLSDVPMLKEAFDFGLSLQNDWDSVDESHDLQERAKVVWLGDWQTSLCGRYEGRVSVIAATGDCYRARVEISVEGGDCFTVELDAVETMRDAKISGREHLDNEFYVRNLTFAREMTSPAAVVKYDLSRLTLDELAVLASESISPWTPWGPSVVTVLRKGDGEYCWIDSKGATDEMIGPFTNLRDALESAINACEIDFPHLWDVDVIGKELSERSVAVFPI